MATYDDNRIEREYAMEVLDYLSSQLQRAQVRHYNIKEKFFQDLVDKQDMVIEYMERT
jgi:hypothetical protein